MTFWVPFFALLGDFMELCRLRSRCSESFKLKVSGRCFAENLRDSYTNLLLYGSRNTFFGHLPGLGAKLSQNGFQNGPGADTKFVPFSPLGLQWCPKSPDAVKLCPQNSNSRYCGPKRYSNRTQTGTHCRALHGKITRAVTEHCRAFYLF